MFKSLFKAMAGHKIVSAIIIIGLATGGYFGYKALWGSTTQTLYVLASVRKGTLISSVSGSGQVSALNQVDVKSKVSGDVVSVGAQNGQEIKANTLIAQLDATDAQRSVRDAETSLETAKLELDKLLEPVDELTLLQAENSLTQAKESKQNAEDSLSKAYDDSFNTVSNAFLDLPVIMTGFQTILFGNTLNSGQQNIDFFADSVKIYDEKVLQYRNDTYNNYFTAKTAYDKNFSDYKTVSRFSDKTVIESLISETYDTTKSIAEATKSAINLIQFYEDKLSEHSLTPQTLANTYLSNLNTYTSKTNSHLLNLFSAKTTIQSDKDSIVSAQRTIEEKTLSLAKTKEGADNLDIRAAKITIQQKQDALLTAKETLANYYIRVPFDGVVAETSVKKGDSVSSGGIIATLISKQQVVEISLNEVDIAKVKVGQKATLTFDAISDLKIDGTVSDIDTIGTVSQGVVTYTIKITLDTQDERVKPGMSVSATIITENKEGVLLVSNSAIKSLGNKNYVEMPNQNESLSGIATSTLMKGVSLKMPIRQQIIEIGSANDSFTEITNGLNQGDFIITKTTQSTLTSNSTSATQSNTNNASTRELFRVTDGGAPGGK